MRRVIVESPYAGDVEANITYARRCLADCLERGETPFAFHLLLTQDGVLDDTIPEQRALGIEVGLEWYLVADAAVVYRDRGISSGMRQGIQRAHTYGVDVEYREIGGEPRNQSAFVTALLRVFGSGSS